jgi:2-(1,2-epoxy-1,2-dihydrophenyl)acetyl-CoA isomerase
VSEPLLLEIRDGGAHVTFNRPEVRNAITRAMLADLADFLATIEGDARVRYLVFRGTGDHFAAGGDVAGFRETLAQAPEERRRAYERRLMANADPFLLLSRVSVPVITVTRGAVAGAGLLFALAADICVAADDSFFVFSHARLGLPLDLGLSWYLPRVVGWRQAKSLTLLSARLDASKALELGVVSEVLPAAEIDARLETLQKTFVEGAREAFRLSKRLLDASLDATLPEQLEREARAVGEAVAHPDFVEGVSAFVENRRPRFGI